MITAARIIGTYSRVSRGRYLVVALSCQKSFLRLRVSARFTRPGPPL